MGGTQPRPGEPVTGTLPLKIQLSITAYGKLVQMGERSGVDAAVIVARQIERALAEPAPRERGRQGRRLTDAELYRMREMKLAGKTTAQIATQIGVAPSTVDAHLKKLIIPRSSKG